MFLSFLLKVILMQIDLSSKDESSFLVFGNRISGWCSVDVWQENWYKFVVFIPQSRAVFGLLSYRVCCPAVGK
jgi:hypothetical protein